MFAKPVIAALLVVGCLGAAAGGAYVAVRHNDAKAPEATLAAAQPAPSPEGEPQKAVAETESVITPAQPEPSPSADPVEVPRRSGAAVREREAPARSAAPARRRGAEPVAPSPRPAATAEPASRAPAPIPSAEPAPPVRSEPPVVDPPVAEPGIAGPPTREFVEVVVPASAVVGLQVETALSSERARVEDRVEARVTRDVSADGRVAIPAGSRVIGSIILVERGGKIKERARLGVRFHTLVFADGTEMPFRSDAVYREGESPGGDSARKIGGAAVGGAVLGAILGGGKGAAIGGAAGAAGGTAASMAGDRKPATLPSGTVLTIRLTQPLTVEVEKDASR